VVDNGSQDGSGDFAAQKAGSRATLISNPANRGYAAAVNQACRAAPECDILLLNPDVEVYGPASFQVLVDFMDQNPRAGAVGPRLLNADGTTQASARPFPSPIAMAGHASAARRLPFARRAAERYLRLPPADSPSRVGWLLGAAMYFRRTAYDEVGGWDERFFLYLEDTDFCRRLASTGWESWYLPSVVLRHLHARDSDSARGGAFRSAARRQHLRSMLRFFIRYPELITSRHLFRTGQ
jgi:N-acetylglucosaminyl-diphospho-decaprenol L-rhamnosyltransferase